MDPLYPLTRVVDQIERVNRPPDVLESQLPVIGGAHACTRTFDHLLCDVAEACAVMDTAF